MAAEWWRSYGAFDPEDEQGHYPHSGQVVAHYRRQKGWSQAELARRLGVHARMIYYLEKQQQGLDSLKRRRQLVELLAIPPELLGLDPQRPRLIGSPPWWVQEGYPAFPAGDDGYPLPGAVIKYYRLQQVRRQQSGERSWTQADLAEALGLSELAIRRMENRSDYLDSSRRRRMLSVILGIPPHLLGLDARRPSVPSFPLPPSPISLLLSENSEEPLLVTYQRQQAELYAEFRASRQPELLTRAWRRLTYLKRLLPLIQNELLGNILRLEFNYAQLVADGLADLYGVASALPFVQHCLSIARSWEQARGQSRTPGKSIYRDLLANALIGQAIAHFELGEAEAARHHAEEALERLAETCPSVQRFVLEEAAHILAHLARDEPERKQALVLLDQAGQLLSPASEDDDPYLLAADVGYYHLNRARTLLALDQARQALGELDQASQHTQPLFTTRRLFIVIYRALAHLMLKDYEVATSLAIQAAGEARALNARRALAHLSLLYQRLKASPYGGTPGVARLGWLLDER
ncbi:MAG: helix-turn-helix domain-containing protein [Thermogemmatispora sp.]|uniref:helix-turn-helix domain-containing protein n=1 Tax=Thermogemmatispora sp. TaxID=1968838 RepID=UPI001A00C87D|nr:helix-turn-helix transcriptional regulator [Thermogemmatispora sp.]MBE3565596.1 helix-turn-helix domain-containing protein [Thermogemmatispora sp.]